MKARHKRLALLLAALAALGVATALVLSAFQKNLVFFFTPTQVWSGEAPHGRRFRVGGLVEAGSLQRGADGLSFRFVVTDLQRRVPVEYRGILPDLFREGKGVVAQGRLQPGGTGGTDGGPPHFVADEVLAKHDENYMPPEAAQALRQAEQARQAGPVAPVEPRP